MENKRVNIGTVGHVDHGWQSLVRRLVAVLDMPKQQDIDDFILTIQAPDDYAVQTEPFYDFGKKARRKGQRRSRRGF